ncbi:MAG: anti-sigma factor family protein, partial [Chloroflexota bacterium]
MIDHETARRSFATSLDFTLDSPDEEALSAHLDGCASCRAFAASMRSDAAALRALDTGAVPISVRANVAIAAEHGRGSNPIGRWVGIVVFAALLLGALGAGVLGVGGRAGVPPAAGPSNGPAEKAGNQIEWKTKLVALTAREFSIDVGGKTFRAATPKVGLNSDPGTPTYRTLEATWLENGVEMRMNLYFRGDGSSYWVDEVRIYDGAPRGEWLTTRGFYFKAQAGNAWTGDQDVAFTDPTGKPARLHLAGVTLATAPIDAAKPAAAGGGGPKPAPVGEAPFDTGGQLHCSGILQMSPQDAQATLRKMGVPVAWEYNHENLTGERR